LIIGSLGSLGLAEVVTVGDELWPAIAHQRRQMWKPRSPRVQASTADDGSNVVNVDFTRKK